MHRHLETLGFVEGSEVDIVAQNEGQVIVSVKGSHLGIGEQTARHIMVV